MAFAVGFLIGWNLGAGVILAKDTQSGNMSGSKYGGYALAGGAFASAVALWLAAGPMRRSIQKRRMRQSLQEGPPWAKAAYNVLYDEKLAEDEQQGCPICGGPKSERVQTCSSLCSKRLRMKVAGRLCKPDTFLKLIRVLAQHKIMTARGLREGVYPSMKGYTPDTVGVSMIMKTMSNPAFITIQDHGSKNRTFELLGGSGLKDWMRPDLYAKMMSLEAESFDAEEGVCSSCNKYAQLDDCTKCGDPICLGCTSQNANNGKIQFGKEIMEFLCPSCVKGRPQLVVGDPPAQLHYHKAESTEAEITEAMISRIGRGGPIGLNQGVYEAENEPTCEACGEEMEQWGGGDWVCRDCDFIKCKECGDTRHIHDTAHERPMQYINQVKEICPDCLTKMAESEFTCECKDHYNKEILFCPDCDGSMCPNTGACACRPTGEWFDYQNDPRTLWGDNHPSWAPHNRVCPIAGVPCNHREYPHPGMSCSKCGIGISVSCHRDSAGCCRNCVHEAEEHQSSERFDAEDLEYKFAIVAKYDPEVLPASDVPGELDPISKVHVTLVGGKALKPFKATLKENAKEILAKLPPAPVPTFGELGIAERTMGDGEVRQTAFFEVSNQDDFQAYVDLMCKALGIDNPEPDRWFHVSVANNHGGNPFKSVGDIAEADLREAESFSADDSKQGLIIPADGGVLVGSAAGPVRPSPVSVEITGLEDMQAVVGGYIERVAGGDDWDLWGNEEALYMDLPPNESARVVTAWAHDTDLDNIIPLSGDFLVLGIDQADGESKDLPENIRDQIIDLLRVSQMRGIDPLPPLCSGCGESTTIEGYCKANEKICQACCDHDSCNFFQTKEAHTDTVHCQCGAQLQWDEPMSAWYCIECPFNTYPTKKEAEQCSICTGLSPKDSERCIICFASLPTKNLERDAEYTRISGGDMDTFLTDHGFTEFNHPRAHERVYDKLYGRGPEGGELVVRIYTSIVKDEARDLGKDAIRVVPLYLHPTLGEFPMSRQKRVHRVLGWRDNLEKRIETAEASAPGPVLDSNGKPMRLRRNRKSGDYFWGSIDYPANTETKSYRGD